MKIYHLGMNLTRSRDLAQIRLDNALALFEEFVTATVKHPHAATLRGLGRRFSERLQIQPSYWSQIKSRTRQIGERLARQFEALNHKPWGWMDQDHAPAALAAVQADGPFEAARGSPPSDDSREPADDDERFIVGLVLTYYRRHPQLARTRLLDLLGEVLAPPPEPAASAPLPGARPLVDDGRGLCAATQSGTEPMKKKKR